MSIPRAAELFPTDIPASGDALIGRDDEVAELTATLAAGVNVILTGAPGSGKTSIISETANRLRSRSVRVLLITLSHVANLPDLTDALAHHALGRYPELLDYYVAAPIQRPRSSEEWDMIDELGPLPAGDEGTDASRTAHRRFSWVLRLPEWLAQRDHTRYVVILDDFEELWSARKPYGEPDELLGVMRSVFQHSHNSTFLFSGREHIMARAFADERESFYRFGKLVSLDRVPSRVLVEALSERFQIASLVIEPMAIQELVRTTQGTPWATMLLAQVLYRNAIGTMRREIVEADVFEAFEEILKNYSFVAERTIGWIRQSDALGLLVARRIARGENPWSGEAPASVARALYALRDLDVIDHEQGRRQWIFIDPYLAEYLARADALGSIERRVGTQWMTSRTASPIAPVVSEVRLDEAFLAEVGLSNLPAADKRAMLSQAYETLALRVGMALTETMSDEQLDEFERLLETNDETDMTKWIDQNVPKFRIVVRDELEKLKGEIRSRASEIVTAARRSQGTEPPGDFREHRT